VLKRYAQIFSLVNPWEPWVNFSSEKLEKREIHAIDSQYI